MVPVLMFVGIIVFARELMWTGVMWGVVGMFTVFAFWTAITAFFTRAVVLQRDRADGRVRMLVRQSSRVVAEADKLVVRVHPVDINYTARIDLRWKGFGVMAHVGSTRFALAVVRTPAEAQEYLTTGPEWVRSAYAGEGELIQGVGNRRLW
jgi:hypothetical protein